MAGAIPVNITTSAVATTIRRDRSHADGTVRPAAGRLLGMRKLARINEAVIRAKAGSAGRLTRWKPTVARANAAQPASVDVAQPDRAAAQPYATAKAFCEMVPSSTGSAPLVAHPFP